MVEIQNIKDIVILGGGTAGWMAAAVFARVLKHGIRVHLVESEDIGTVGVGEATIPLIKSFNQFLGLDENEFLRATHGTFKLGIEFVDWGAIGERYMHGFGAFGQELAPIPFEQYWQRMYQLGKAPDLGEYSLERVAAYRNKFMRPTAEVQDSPLNKIGFAFHFDASLYARYLRVYSESRGIQRVEGKVVDVRVNGETGFLQTIVLDNGMNIDGDLFIDCSGFRGLLIEETLKTGYEDWTHWLPCDRAVAIPCASTQPLSPYTRATAHRAGWQWRIPLQHRTGNGHVFSRDHVSDDEAIGILMANLDGEPLSEPRTLHFKAGMRRQAWNKNCIAVGLASGFLEPLESTSIHMIQTMLYRILSFFPDAGFDQFEIDEFNRQTRFEYERVRDFIILHYHVTRRNDSDFWNYCRTMSIPETLKSKIEMYCRHGRIFRMGNELFAEPGWLQVMHGQGLRAKSFHPLAGLLSEDKVIQYLEEVRGVITRCADAMPDHATYVARQCAA